MNFTEIFIRKPVLASVVSLFIFLLGLRAATELNVRQYPELENAVITVTTVYVGADSDLVQGFITTPLEQEIATADGIDYMVSTSVQGISTIQIYVDFDYDPNEVLTQVVAKVNRLRSELPEEAEDSSVDMALGESTAAMYLSFSSDILDNNQITDYLTRVIQPKLSTIAGVQRARLLGNRTFAMRIWLRPADMAAQEVTPADVSAALRRNNVLSAVGATKGAMVAMEIRAKTDIASPEAFRSLVVRADGDRLVRLGDVAEVELGAESYDTSVSFNGRPATFVAIEVAPDANSLDVIRVVRETLEQEIFPQLPEGMIGDIPYDSTEYIQDSIDEVVKTIVEAVLIVILVIYLFLGSLRSVLIPAIAVPLSLVGALFLMLLMGFSINLLTLLSMVLAIGIVVDDAIIVLENVHRHIEEGMVPQEAAIVGARELAWPVVAMTTTLIAVYLPIGFLGGLVGTLFIEFAFSLAGAVLLSGVVALTLSPMMSAKILRPRTGGGNRLEKWLEMQFNRLQESYKSSLHSALNDRLVILLFGAIVLVSCYFLFVSSPRELEPAEDRGLVLAISSADAYATLDYLEQYTAELTQIAERHDEVANFFLLNGVGGTSNATNSAVAGYVLAPWNLRDKDTAEMQAEISAEVAQIAGLKVAVVVPPSLPTAGGRLPVEFVIGATEPVERLADLADEIMARAIASRKFIFVDSDLKIDKPKIIVEIDRDKAAAMGVSMADIGRELGAMLSGAYINRFSLDNRSYKVIPQVVRVERLTGEQLENYYIRAVNGDLVPISTLVNLRETVEPQQLKRFQQLNAVTISGVPRPGITLGEALRVLDQAAREILPQGYSVDYAGQSRQYKSEGGELEITFLFALIVIYLVLAAQFESWRDPLIMLVTVPMSVCGAMIFVSLGLTTLNIYTQVGLVTLIGVISKHGILVVEFANKLQEQGHSKREAIEQAASIRLRPILMTTASLVLAMVPLLAAAGPGGGARFAMGLVVASGMTIGTLFTLFVVPAMYLYLGRDYGY
ncbi:efflux RND transporter permease subunit [Microbulbifer thermotolerans]|uniref:efflux RND transporter permease subunit n=1 Tax=Microbulbifer thermotolerans TaxID=252514 RepID=UPI00224B0431|nr:efflux RND transporter permease subunit [Microbulbifer thermotolerans]MCX2835603.1 efflux RND transporter permease subunit [Microbulbifer thermotolerans]WKT61146.1 efflux RND transporter permease subunit [Microbulbifer thermotolerans]